MNKIFMNRMFLVIMVAMLSMCAYGCAEPGSEGETVLDCGKNGTYHNGHCHCDTGFLFDGETCVTPEQITAVCAEESGEEHENQEGEHEDEHAHHACVCKAAQDCPCDHGVLEVYGTQTYCVPEFDRD